MCYIEEMEGEPLFKVKVVEKGHDDLILTGPTPKGKHHPCKVTCKIIRLIKRLIIDQIIAVYRITLIRVEELQHPLVQCFHLKYSRPGK